MEKLTVEEKKFFEMIKSKDIKKISINLSVETINRIDELAKMFKITRTLVIESIIMTGLKEYLKVIESANKKIRTQDEYKDKKKTEKLDIMLDSIEKFKNKWNL